MIRRIQSLFLYFIPILTKFMFFWVNCKRLWRKKQCLLRWRVSTLFKSLVPVFWLLEKVCYIFLHTRLRCSFWLQRRADSPSNEFTTLLLQLTQDIRITQLGNSWSAFYQTTQRLIVPQYQFYYSQMLIPTEFTLRSPTSNTSTLKCQMHDVTT